MATHYRIYKNDGAGGAINYGSVVATITSGTTWDTPPIPTGSDIKYAVRAFDSVSGQEESNVDAAVQIVTDASGVDISLRPMAPSGLTATPRPGGKIRVEWHSRVLPRDTRKPTTFKVYKGTGGVVDYGTVVATVTAELGQFSYSADISSLTGGTSYVFGVRAENAIGQEKNTTKVTAVANTTAPDNVDSLTITATS